MSTFIPSFKNEWCKLLRRKKYIVFVVLGLAVCIAWGILGQLITNLVARSGGALLRLAPTPMGALPFFLQVLLPFLIFMAMTDLITVESSDNTMKAMLIAPVERWKLYAAKLTAVMAYSAMYLGCIFIASAILSAAFGKGQSAGDIFISLGSYSLTLIPLAILASYAALIALLGKSGTLTMFILILSYLAMNVLPIVFPVLSEMLFTSYLGWYKLWIGALPGFTKMLHMLLIVLGYGVTFFMAGSIIFDRKDY